MGRPIALASFGACVLLLGSPVVASPISIAPASIAAKPDLAVAVNGTPGFKFTGLCTSPNGYVSFSLLISNIGSAASPAVSDTHAVWVSDQRDLTWAGGASLPAIGTGISAVVSVIVPAKSPPSAMTGTHTFNVSVNAKPWFAELSMANNATTITVSGAPACLKTLSNLSGVRGGGAVLPTPAPVRLKSGLYGLVPPQIAAPKGLWYTNDPTVCTNHSGLLGALICPAMLADGTTLALIWDWNAGLCGGNCVSNIDGFHIYKVTAGHSSGQYVVLPTRKLVDTQSDPNMTIRGIKPFASTDCFVVTAFASKQESPDSDTYCVNPQMALGTEEVRKDPTAEQTREAFNVACAHPNTYDSAFTLVYGSESGTQAFQSNTCQGNENFQGLFAFDLSYAHKAKSAIMHLQPLNGTSCATKIAETDMYWPAMNPANYEAKHFQGINANWEWDLPTLSNGEMTLDVTPAYDSRWVGSRTGFAFIGPSADWGQFQPPSCITNYAVWIDVVQFK